MAKLYGGADLLGMPFTFLMKTLVAGKTKLIRLPAKVEVLEFLRVEIESLSSRDGFKMACSSTLASQNCCFLLSTTLVIKILTFHHGCLNARQDCAYLIYL